MLKIEKAETVNRWLKEKRKLNFAIKNEDKEFLYLYISEVEKIVGNQKHSYESRCTNRVDYTEVEIRLLITEQKYKVLIQEIERTLGVSIKEEKQQ